MATYEPVYSKKREWVNTGTPDGEIMVFHPTAEEFANFSKYIEKIEQNRAHLASGVCKIVPPPGWHPRPSKNPSDYSDIDNFVIECPVRERIEGGSSTGCYVKANTVYRKEMRVADFRKMAFSKQYRFPKTDYDLNELERHFWRNLLHHEPIYGADTPGSIYDADVREFNMNNLGTILDLLKAQKVMIKGVNTVFLYFGMWKTMFPWHAEDMDLYSINYLHFGEPKFWYAIPSQAADRFERLAAQRFPDGLQICKAFLRHKVYVISPSVLRTHGIPYGTMVQYPGEFMITFPRGYHMGFNLGYNCAESTNFALERWIDFGKNAVVCTCRHDCVEIDMRPFMQKYRPTEYKEWLEYWYGDRPTALKPKKRVIATRSRSHRSKSKSRSDTGSEDSLPAVPCTTRQKAIFKARKPMRDLWANQPVNLFAEKQHNIKCGRLYPHCSVCQYFVRRETWMNGRPTEQLPEKSKRYVSDQMFEKRCRLNANDEPMEWMLKEDSLLECSNCRVIVHQSCYPDLSFAKAQNTRPNGESIADNEVEQSSSTSIKVEPSSEARDSWLCERCYNRNDILIRSTSCTLCELRGGALMALCPKEWSPGPGFVHVICALMDQGTHFLQPDKRMAPYNLPPRRLIPPHLDEVVSASSPPLLSAEAALPSNPMATQESILNDSGIGDSSINNTSAIPEQMMPSLEQAPQPANSLLCINATTKSMTPTDWSPSPFRLPISPCWSCCSASTPTTQSSNISEYPASYQCEVCGQQSDHLIRCDVCVEEEEIGAKLRFHITCAPLADVTFECRELPNSLTSVMTVCAFHHTAQCLEAAASMEQQQFELKQRVVVDLNDPDEEEEKKDEEKEERLVGYGLIYAITEHLYATVDFLDGSSSSDIFPCDIFDCECKAFGCDGVAHIPGSVVYVSWEDDQKSYQAYYRGKNPRTKYKIKLFPPLSFELKELRKEEEDEERPRSSNKLRDDEVELTSNSIYRRDDMHPEHIRRALLKRKSIEVSPNKSEP